MVGHELREVARSTIDGNSGQGLHKNGGFTVESSADSGVGDAFLRLYDASYNLLADRDCSSDGTARHLGDVFIDGAGVVYVTASKYPSTPYDAKVKKYTFTTSAPYSFSYVTEYDLGYDAVMEGIDKDSNGDFWTNDNANGFKKWESGFINPTTYTPDFVTSPLQNSHGFQTLRFDADGNIWTNVHDGASPHTTVVFEVDDTNHALKLKAHYQRPRTATQGLCFDGDEVLMLERVYGAGADAIVICKLVPDDHRDKFLKVSGREASIGVVSTTLTEIKDTNQPAGSSDRYFMRRKNYVQKGDIIRAVLQCHAKTSTGGNARITVDIGADNTVSLSEMYEPRSIRTSTTNSEYYAGTQVAHYVANEAGVMELTASAQISTGTLTIANCFLTQKIEAVDAE